MINAFYRELSGKLVPMRGSSAWIVDPAMMFARAAAAPSARRFQRLLWSAHRVRALQSRLAACLIGELSYGGPCDRCVRSRASRRHQSTRHRSRHRRSTRLLGGRALLLRVVCAASRKRPCNRSRDRGKAEGRRSPWQPFVKMEMAPRTSCRFSLRLWKIVPLVRLNCFAQALNFHTGRLLRL